MAHELILVVDDNAANLKIARVALESEGFVVRTAADGQQALEALREIHPRLILMDIQLPHIDGFELTRRIKAAPATRDIVIVAVTAYAMKSDRETALAAGCDGYITKPLDPIQLPLQVAQYLRSRSDAVESVGADAPRTTVALEPFARGPRILVIEDNPMTRKLYRIALEDAGYDVIEAGDGANGLRLLAESRPALILLDLVLPDIDGLELMQRIRAQLGDQMPPILCVSGFLARIDELHVGTGGFAQMLLKPIDPEQLVEIVHAHIGEGSDTAPAHDATTVLLVEDDPAQRKLMRLWLRNAGWRVTTANDGEAGLALARREHPAVIVSDILMPKLDGFALCQAVREDPELAQTPIVLLSSAYGDPADHELARRVGASALVPKIEGLDGLVPKVAALIASAPPPLPPTRVHVEKEHLERALWQLERQMQMNARLAQRAMSTDRLLLVLAQSANALMGEDEAISTVLADALNASLDIAGISKGALYLFESDGRLALSYSFGFRERERSAITDACGYPALLAETARGGQVLPIPGHDFPADAAQALSIAAGAPALLLVPIAWGDVAHGLLLLGGRTSDVANENAVAFGRIIGAELGKTVGLARYAFRLATSERRYRVLTEHAYDAISLTTPDGVIREVNARLVEILGYPSHELIGRNVASFATAGRSDTNSEVYRDIIAAGAGRTQPVELLRADGNTVLMEFSSAMVTIDGERLMLSIGRDVTTQVRALERLEFNASHDQTTGLPRLEIVENALCATLAHAAAQDRRVAVLYFDLDFLHAINETRGREAGDCVLRRVAERLSRFAQKKDMVGHVAADEFVLIQDNAGTDPIEFAESIRASIAEAIEYGEQPIFVTTSIGVSCFPDNAMTAKDLLRAAEAASIRAKEEGRDCASAFSNDENARMRNRLTLGPQLRDAIRGGQFVLHYQPLISGLDWQVLGFETLVRWQHPTRGLLHPEAFIRAAEELGIIVELGSYVLDEACRQARAWLDAGIADFTVSVNVAAQQFQRPEFVDEMATTLAKYALPRGCVELELTEASMVNKVERVIATMLELHELGVRLAIDDFGTGFSSLNYLRRLPVDCLKIDQSFVRDIVSDSGAAGICVAVIALGHQLGMRVLAEGVETSAQVGYLKRNECDMFQGFYFCKPVPAVQAFEMLRHRYLAPEPVEEGEPLQTLLIVDDEANIINALSRTLRRDGYRILAASDGEQALEILAREEVHVILSDQRMPGMCGTELLSKVKDLHPHTVRLVLSGYTDLSAVTDAINRGAIYKFLTKPWNDEELRLQIRDAFRVQAREATAKQA